MREWLILLGAVIVIGIVLDGVRRMHRARKDSLEISRGMGADQLDESPLDSYNPELPGGGARIIDRLGVSERERNEAADRPLPAHSRYEEPSEPSETGLSAGDLDDQLPEDFTLHAEARDDADRAWSSSGEVGADRRRHPEQASSEPETETDDIPTLETPSGAPRPAADAQVRRVERTKARAKPEKTRPVSPQPKRNLNPPAGAAKPAPSAAQAASKRAVAGANRPPAKEVFVINVDSKSSEGFRGGDLKRLFEACGLEHGDMGIYHRHENDDTETPVQFSVANAVEPGTFSPATMENVNTPGISFFMSLPGPNDSLQAYDFMIETAQCVVRNLGGDLKDERRSVMTSQTIEHGRQRVREFERKRRSVKA